MTNNFGNRSLIHWRFREIILTLFRVIPFGTGLRIRLLGVGIGMKIPFPLVMMRTKVGINSSVF